MKCHYFFVISVAPLGPLKGKMEDDLSHRVGDYIRAKRSMTVCMQEHFRQVCHQCRQYANCSIYAEYVAAWSNLQDAYQRY